jgi:hypothetical protein
MKKIATIYNNFNIYQYKKTFKTFFEYNNYSMNLDNIVYYKKLSEETYCYTADILLNGKKVGTCKNDGCGGETTWYQNDKILLDFSCEVNKLPHPFIQYQLSIVDICDELFELDYFVIKGVKTINKLKTKLHSQQQQIFNLFNVVINVTIHTEKETEEETEEINTKTYKIKDIPKVLKEMGSYFKSCTIEEQEKYFQQIINMGLFHDACGKIEFASYQEVIVLEDY